MSSSAAGHQNSNAEFLKKNGVASVLDENLMDSEKLLDEIDFLVKDKRVLITSNEWFVPIEKAYPELEAEYNRLELDKNIDSKRKNELFAELILSWGG